ncbi:DUF87 domain-containing protein [Tumidithrix helvetica PCC 7403]|uniref:type IV secretory system conjugative DNA transfer family protein n=1 Tax=Tumidithrix helvetica TaxID=3457545 RepID=UPI003CB35E77
MNITNDQFHPSQVLLGTEVKRVSSKASNCALIAGCALSLACLLPSHWTSKTINLAVAGGLFGLSFRLQRLCEDSSDYEQIATSESKSGFGVWLNASFEPPRRKEVAIAPTDPLEPIKFADIREALKKPHIMLVGSTGAGKSTLAKYLAANCQAYVIVIDPHMAKGDWGDLPVYGAKRNYTEIAEIMGVLLELMQRRHDRRPEGETNFAPVVIIADEYPSIAASPEAGKIASSWMKLISREARKVSIRLVLLTQSPEVKAIGLEGEGSVRDNFCFVRLGEFAIDHAKSLKDVAVSNAVENASRPCLIGNTLCNLPELSDRIAMPVVSIPADFAELTSVDKLTSIDELTSVDSSLLPANGQSSPVNLSKPLASILEYAKRQAGFVTASQVKAGVRLFRDSPVSEIRSYFQWLCDRGYGTVRGDAESLEFSAG